MATTSLGTALPRVDLLVQAGETLTLSVAVLQAGGTAVAANDLVSARAQIRPEVLSSELLHLFSTEEDPPNVAITGTTAAVLVITATSAETSLWQATWPSLTAWWDVEVTDADDIPHQLVQPGLITLSPEVTR